MWKSEEKLIRERIKIAERIAIILSLFTIFLSAIGFVWIVRDIEHFTNLYEADLTEYQILLSDSVDALDEGEFHLRGKRQDEYIRYRATTKRSAHGKYRPNGHGPRAKIQMNNDRFDDAKDDEEDEDTDYRPRGEERICDCSRIKCPRGPRGPPGEDGLRAQNGFPGVPGKPGVDGIFQMESVCDPCPPGRRGAPGATGHGGTRGRPGTPGVPGRDGVNEKGPPGEDGPRGPSGRPGKKGTAGELGQDAVQLVGTPGPPGRLGPRGFAGPRGDPGKNGPPAMPGEEGPRGPPGESGLRGEQGLPGPTGRPGAPGKDGGYCNCPSRNGETPLGFDGEFDPSEYPDAGHYEKTTRKPSRQTTIRRGLITYRDSAEETYEPRRPVRARGQTVSQSEVEFDLRR